MNTEGRVFHNWSLKQVTIDKKNQDFMSHIYTQNLYSLSDLLEEEVVHLYFFLSLSSHLAHH